MGELIIQEMRRLTPKTEFKGVSIPAFDGQYYCVDLGAYEAHIVTTVGEKLERDSGLCLKFAGFTDAVVGDGICKAEMPEVWYSLERQMFVFKHGGVLFSEHPRLSAVYNADGNTIRQDKIFLNGQMFYAYDEAHGGIMRISDVEVLDRLGDSEKATVSQAAITKEFAKVSRAVEDLKLGDIDGGYPETIYTESEIIDCGII